MVKIIKEKPFGHVRKLLNSAHRGPYKVGGKHKDRIEGPDGEVKMWGFPISFGYRGEKEKATSDLFLNSAGMLERLLDANEIMYASLKTIESKANIKGIECVDRIKAVAKNAMRSVWHVHNLSKQEQEVAYVDAENIDD